MVDSFPSHIAYEHQFESLVDRYGHKIALEDLAVGHKLGDDSKYTSQLSCTSGYFNLWFENGCGMEGTSAVEIARRDVLCKVFYDISQLIKQPTPPANNALVNIWIRDVHYLDAYPCANGVLGGASSFYPIPYGNSGGGIADNLVWQTINSSIDAYTGLTPPIFSIGGGNGNGFYHAIVAFNFGGCYDWFPNSAWISGTVLPSAPSPTAAYHPYDLYTVCLHEVVHALGFGSLISSNGSSALGLGLGTGNYYNRYDTHLQTQNGQSLISNGGGSCNMYSYSYTAPISALSPSPTNCCNQPANMLPCNSTTCSTAIKYVSNTNPNQPVYTPNCFELGSSLSHFEDICTNTPSTYIGCSATGGDCYFTMSNANDVGTNKRYLQQEEKNVLCDIGYSVANHYGTVGNPVIANSYKDYITTCGGNAVVGINDGISGALYQFIGTVNSTAATILGATILSNDFDGATSSTPNNFECLEDMTDPSAIILPSTLNGTSATTITVSSAIAGQHLMRYVPFNASGVRGNITYIIVYFISAACPISDPCNIVSNGSFENATHTLPTPGSGVACSPILTTPYNNADCWSRAANTYDMYSSNSPCIGSNNAYPTSFFSPIANPTSLWTPNTNPNTTFIGLAGWYLNSFPNCYIEAIQNQLSSPLIPGQHYKLKLRAKVGNRYNANDPYYILRVMGSGSILPNNPNFSFVGNPNVPDIIPLPTPYIKVPNSATAGGATIWQPFTYSFTCPSLASGGNINYLILVCDAQQQANLYGPFAGANPFGFTDETAYIYVDDVSIEPDATAISLTLPSSGPCYNPGVIPDLSVYLSPSAIPGGTFSGAGVSPGPIYSYNPTTAGTGVHTIIYTYNDINGCQHTASDNIWGGASPLTVNFTTTSAGDNTTTCLNNPATITATISGGVGVYSFVWSSPCGNIVGTPVSSSYSSTATVSTPFAPCVFNVTISNATCTFTVTYTSTAVSPLMISTNTNTFSLPPLIIGTTINVAANITLTVNSNFTLDGCNVMLGDNAIIDIASGYTLNIKNASHLHACHDMWSGINVNPNAIVKLQSNSILEQAINGITTNGNGKFDIDQSFMYNNFIHILMQPCTTVNTSSIKNSILDGKHGGIAHLLSPKNTSLNTENAIQIYDNFATTIGTPTAGFTNIITNSNKGIFIINTVPANTNKTYIYNNSITNMSFCGVYDSNVVSTANNKFLYVGHLTIKAPYLNTFNNCLFGIRSISTINQICNNDLTGGLRAITCRFNYTKSENVSYNDIHLPREVGISIEYSSQPTTGSIYQIYDHNNITMSSIGLNCPPPISQNGGVILSKPCLLQNAIRHLDNMANYNGHLEINYNYIDKPDRGIFVSGGNHDLVHGNIIKLPSPYPKSRVEGINATSSTAIAVENNTITKLNGTFLTCGSGINNICYSVGITYNTTTNSYATCNSINLTSRGLESNSVTTNLQYRGNIMNANDVGWYRMNNSFPGNQGSATSSNGFWGNLWMGGMYTNLSPQTYTKSTSGATNTLIYVPSSPPSPSYNSFFNEHDIPSNTTFFVQSVPNSNYPYSCGGSNGGGGNTHPSFNYNENGYVSYAELIAADAVQYPDYPEEARYIDIQHLLEAIREDATLLENEVIDSFYTEIQDDNVTRFDEFGNAIATGQLGDAEQILQDIDPNGTIELNTRQVDEIYLNTIAVENDEFTEEQRDVLNQIAFQCPFTGGNAVWQARNMLALTDTTNYDDSLLCGENYAYRQVSHPSIVKSSKHILANANYFTIYPNPTNSIAFIKWNLATDCNNCSIKIVNVLGEIVKEQKGLNQKGRIEISTSSLPAGIYHCLLVTNNAVTESKKLVIIK